MNSPAGISAPMVEVAFTPPHSATATADRAAARAAPGPMPREALASGSRTHGAIAIAMNPPDSSPSMLMASGDSA